MFKRIYNWVKSYFNKNEEIDLDKKNYKLSEYSQISNKILLNKLIYNKKLDKIFRMEIKKLESSNLIISSIIKVDSKKITEILKILIKKDVYLDENISDYIYDIQERTNDNYIRFLKIENYNKKIIATDPKKDSTQEILEDKITREIDKSIENILRINKNKKWIYEITKNQGLDSIISDKIDLEIKVSKNKTYMKINTDKIKILNNLKTLSNINIKKSPLWLINNLKTNIINQDFKYIYFNFTYILFISILYNYNLTYTMEEEFIEIKNILNIDYLDIILTDNNLINIDVKELITDYKEIKENFLILE